MNQSPLQNMLSTHNDLHKSQINVYLMLTKVFVTEGHVVFPVQIAIILKSPAGFNFLFTPALLCQYASQILGPHVNMFSEAL